MSIDAASRSHLTPGESPGANSEERLFTLAGMIVSRINPGRGDRYGRDDCFQTAYLAGLQALRSAQRHGRPVSIHYLLLAMQSTVYRLLHSSKELCESDLFVA